MNDVRVSTRLGRAAELQVTMHRSALPEQGSVVCLTAADGQLEITAYEGYGVRPPAVAERLRELADEIERCMNS